MGVHSMRQPPACNSFWACTLYLLLTSVHQEARVSWFLLRCSPPAGFLPAQQPPNPSPSPPGSTSQPSYSSSNTASSGPGTQPSLGGILSGSSGQGAADIAAVLGSAIQFENGGPSVSEAASQQRQAVEASAAAARAAAASGGSGTTTGTAGGSGPAGSPTGTPPPGSGR